MNKPLALIMLIALSLSGPWASATEARHFSGSKPVRDEPAGDEVITQLKLKVPSGQVTIKTTESKLITYDVIVKEAPSSWFGADLDTLVLEQKVDEQTLALTIDEDDVSQVWTITVPESLAMTVQLGVGNVEADALTQPFTADIGVGAVWLSLDQADYAEIQADVAVGEIQVQGLEAAQLKQQRHLVSEQMHYTGQGSHVVAVRIGVGDVNISRPPDQHTVAALSSTYSDE